MVGLKKRSKRMTTKRRVKIEKKVKEHNRKKRKEAKKNPKKGKKKDPGVPSSLPFRETVLKELEEKKKQDEDAREKKREMLKKQRQKKREDQQNSRRNLGDMMKDAAKRQEEYYKKHQPKETDDGESMSKSVEKSRQTYVKEFRKVVEAADVVLEVLDARDPLGSRCQELESIVQAASTKKKLVLILNKIDLIPKENAAAWVRYLQNELPTVAFKASTQTQNDHLSQRKMQLTSLSDNLAKSSHCLGADVLMKLLGNYGRTGDIRTTIRVGVVGFPNTGKSSIINSLKRSKACTVGALPGITRIMQEVNLDKHIKLLDSPGVVMDTDQSPTAAVLRNVVKLEAVEDPALAVESILSRCDKEQLMLHYNIPDYSNVDEFLLLLAKRQGKLKKGGVPDASKAARAVLQDWTRGRITYYTHPPEDRSIISTTICSELKEAFDINSATLQALSDKPGQTPMLVDSMGPVTAVVDDEAVDEDMEEEEEDQEGEGAGGRDKEMSEVTVKPQRQKTSKAKEAEPKAAQVQILQANRDRKKAYKKMKKDRKRRDVVASDLSSGLETAFNVGLGDDDD